MCPHGHKNCPIYGLNAHVGYIKAYECIDIENDLETCGGCVANDSPFGYRNADGGRDCSAIPNVDAVRCLGGECLISEFARQCTVLGLLFADAGGRSEMLTRLRTRSKRGDL